MDNFSGDKIGKVKKLKKLEINLAFHYLHQELLHNRCFL